MFEKFRPDEVIPGWVRLLVVQESRWNPGVHSLLSYCLALPQCVLIGTFANRLVRQQLIQSLPDWVILPNFIEANRVLFLEFLQTLLNRLSEPIEKFHYFCMDVQISDGVEKFLTRLDRVKKSVVQLFGFDCDAETTALELICDLVRDED